MSTRTGPQWRRMLGEGGVIVTSILLAFGIDATWDLRREAEAERARVRALLAEIESNAPELEDRLRRGEETLAAQVELIDRIRPSPEDLSADSLAALLRAAMSYGIAEVESGALDAVLVSTDEEDPDQARLLRMLRRYRTELEDLRSEDRSQFIDRRDALQQHLWAVSPYAWVWADFGVHGPTRFEVPTRALLMDAGLQGRLSSLALRTSQMTLSIETLIVLADSIVEAATPLRDR